MKIGVLLAVPLLGFMKLGARPERESQGKIKSPGRARAGSKVQAQAVTDLKPYRAVSITTGKGACDAVATVAGTRFLVAEGNAPMLPVPGCDAGKCGCRYAHHEDRREHKEDRRLTGSLHSELYESAGNSNRRAKKRGRRKTDF